MDKSVSRIGGCVFLWLEVLAGILDEFLRKALSKVLLEEKCVMQPLLERAESREPADHARLMESIQTRVEKMAAYFGRRCGVDEDDLRQEAWLAVLEILPRLDHSVGTPEQHLLKRARWRILDTIRRQHRRQHVPLDDVPPNMASYLDARSGIDLGALFARLTITQQRILRALMEGYTWREVGAIVGCTSANVAYHVRRIRDVYIQMNGDEEG